MNVSFPKVLPYPTVSNYVITPGEAIIRTEMEAGAARQRRRFTQVPSRISVRWVMRRQQFAIFEAWYKHKAKEGGEWFHITLLSGLGLLEQEARFTRQFSAKLLNGYLWEITSELEIKERPTIDEGALEIILEDSLEFTLRVTDKLHILVHQTLKDYL